MFSILNTQVMTAGPSTNTAPIATVTAPDTDAQVPQPAHLPFPPPPAQIEQDLQRLKVASEQKINELPPKEIDNHLKRRPSPKPMSLRVLAMKAAAHSAELPSSRLQ